MIEAGPTLQINQTNKNSPAANASRSKALQTFDRVGELVAGFTDTIGPGAMG